MTRHAFVAVILGPAGCALRRPLILYPKLDGTYVYPRQGPRGVFRNGVLQTEGQDYRVDGEVLIPYMDWRKDLVMRY